MILLAQSWGRNLGRITVFRSIEAVRIGKHSCDTPVWHTRLQGNTVHFCYIMSGTMIFIICLHKPQNPRTNNLESLKGELHKGGNSETKPPGTGQNCTTTIS